MPSSSNVVSGHEETFPFLGSIVIRGNTVAPDTPIKTVADEFFTATKVDALAVVDDLRPIGLVMRVKLLSKVFRQFGWEIYSRKPISVLADPHPLTLSTYERLDRALEAALARREDDIYDDIVVVDADGHYAGLLAVKQLVVQQTHALANIIIQKELAHERARELEEIGRIKSQFLANVTHELRSPVNAIIELTELLRIAAGNGYIRQMNDRLGLLMASATNLRGVITNMLDLSKIEAGRMTVISEAFDIAAVVREVADTARVLLASKPVEVVAVTDEPSMAMESDPVKVRQIVMNLASNAAKFTESGRITIGLERAGETIRVSVEDTGPGIRTHDLERLFIAFNQLEDAHTKRHEGTGLGLTISKELAQLLGGRICVTSEFGRGSTFTVELPSVWTEEH